MRSKPVVGDQPQTPINDKLFLKANGLFTRIKLCDLMYIEADGSYTVFHTIEKQYVQSYNLFAVQNQLRQLPHRFFRVHRSFLVNMEHVTHFDKCHVVVAGKNIPIGKTYRDRFIECLKPWMVS